MITLTDEQKKTVRQWVTEGAGLSEIQKKIGAEFKIPVTFMDARFLILDLGLKIKENENKVSPALDLSKAAPAKAGTDEMPLEEQTPPGGVSVELDRVVKAGAIVSGSVTFSDGQKAAWQLDQFGRLGLAAGKAGYRPSEEDLQAFQQELTRLIQSRGF
jgi:hypothetical protein